MKKTTYLPVSPDYFELLEQEIKKGTVRVFYFGLENYPQLEESSGYIRKISRNAQNEYFLDFENGDEVRLDRIVVFSGIPGPAYDEYDAYALAPLTCKAGYADEEEEC